MLKVGATISNAKRLAARVEAARKRSARNQEIAVRVEMFRLWRKLRDEVRQGRPGGVGYANELSRVASYTATGRLKKNTAPLSRTARMIRYNIQGQGTGEFTATFGYTDSKTQRMSMRYKQLMLAHQMGTEALYGHGASRTALGRRWARIGGKLKKRGNPDARFFFLRRETGRPKLPRRPIIDPFWRVNRVAAMRNVRENFNRKMRGERI